MKLTHINHFPSHKCCHVNGNRIWSRRHIHHSKITCTNVPNSDWDWVASDPYTYTNIQLYSIRGGEWHYYSSKNQIYGSEIPLGKVPWSTTTISFLLGPWIQQVGRLYHQAPPANLPWIKSPLISRRCSETVPTPSSTLLKHQMQSCIF